MRDGFDHADCAGNVVLLDTGNEHVTVFLNVDLNIALCTNLLDNLAARTDNLTNLVYRNLQAESSSVHTR